MINNIIVILCKRFCEPGYASVASLIGDDDVDLVIPGPLTRETAITGLRAAAAFRTFRGIRHYAPFPAILRLRAGGFPGRELGRLGFDAVAHYTYYV